MNSLFSCFHRTMSIPVTLSELHRKLEKIPPALLPPCHQANQEVVNALLLSPCATRTDSSSSNLPERASVADKVIPGPACKAKSELLHAINMRATDSLFPLCPVDAVQDWSPVSHPPELI